MLFCPSSSPPTHCFVQVLLPPHTALSKFFSPPPPPPPHCFVQVLLPPHTALSKFFFPHTLLCPSSSPPHTLLCPSSSPPHTLLCPSSSPPHTLLCPSSSPPTHCPSSSAYTRPHFKEALVLSHQYYWVLPHLKKSHFSLNLLPIVMKFRCLFGKLLLGHDHLLQYMYKYENVNPVVVHV